MDTSSRERIRQTLYDNINNTIIAFALKYRFPVVGQVDEAIRSASIEGRKEKQRAIHITRDNAVASFESLAIAVRATSSPLYLIIDEYDYFANKLLFENQELYGSVVMYEPARRDLPVLRSIFDTVKAENDKGIFRCLVMGLSPLALNDGSLARDSFDTASLVCKESLGFTRNDLDKGLEYIIEVLLLKTTPFLLCIRERRI